MNTVTITVNGEPLQVDAGCTVATALLNAGISSFRTSVSGEARAPLCGMGICYECRVSVNHVGQRRACMVIVADGMVVDRDG